MNRLLRNSFRAFALVCSTALVAACSTDGASPMAPATPTVAAAQAGAQNAYPGLLDGVVGGVVGTVNGLTGSILNILGRVLPVSHDITVTKVIGRNGGTITIDATGLQLVVPPGAVDTNVVFSVTAMAGNSVAYKFEPHGLTFKQPLLLKQSVLHTLWLPGLPLGGGYFKDDAQVDTQGKKAVVDERLPATLQGLWITIKLWHFSGYLVSCA